MSMGKNSAAPVVPMPVMMVVMMVVVLVLVLVLVRVLVLVVIMMMTILECNHLHSSTMLQDRCLNTRSHSRQSTSSPSFPPKHNVIPIIPAKTSTATNTAAVEAHAASPFVYVAAIAHCTQLVQAILQHSLRLPD
jgi:hypothetical protein